MLQKNLDLVIIAQKETSEVPWQTLKNDYLSALQSIRQN
jgi:hypothetical protein